MNEVPIDGQRVSYIREHTNKVLEFLSAEPYEFQKAILELALADTNGRLAIRSVEEFEKSSFREACNQAYKTYLNCR